MFNILQIQYSAESAGSAAIRLHKAFLAANLNSNILSLHDGINRDERTEVLGKKSKIIAQVDRKLQAWLIKYNKQKFGLYSYPILGTNISKLKQVKRADVIYLHWVQGGFLNIANLEQLVRLGKPTFLFMHDMWAITGGCHHSFTCEKYKIHCDDCPILNGHARNDYSSYQFAKKLKVFSKYDNLYFVSPSRWLFDCAKRSAITKNKPIFYIPNLIDNTVFKSINKSLARNILNIDDDETVIAFGCISINSPYKGWNYLQKALEILKKEKQNKKVTVLIFGGSYNKKIADEIPFKTKFTGFLRDEYSMLLIYNAADVFVVPSIADNLPTTVLESMSCGTAVVGFNVGGIPDMINHKVNGYLAEYKNSEDIARGICYCIDNNIKGSLLSIFEKAHLVKRHLEMVDSIAPLLK